MPKVKPLGVTQREKDRLEEERILRNILGQIAACKKMLGLNTEELCARIGISQPTMSRREKNPRDFSIGEVLDIWMLMRREGYDVPMPLVEVLG